MNLIKLLLAILILTANSVWAGNLEDADAAIAKKDYFTALKIYKISAE